MVASIEKDWKTQFLRSRYLDPRALVEYLDNRYRGSYKLSSQRGIFIIYTPNGLSEEELAQIEEAAKPKQALFSKRNKQFKSSQRNRSPKESSEKDSATQTDSAGKAESTTQTDSAKKPASPAERSWVQLGFVHAAIQAFKKPKSKIRQEAKRPGSPD